MEMEHKGHKTFIFSWKIKNLWISLERCFSSPRFVVEALNRTEWHLELEPKQDYNDEHMHCHLQRDDDNGPESIDVDFEISLTFDDENPSENVWESRFSFKKGDSCSFDEFGRRNAVFRRNFVTLKLNCRMWVRDIASFIGAAQCSARTLIADKRVKTLKWIVEGISLLSTVPTMSIPLDSSTGSSLTLKMILMNGGYRIGGFKVNAKGIDSERVLLIISNIFVLDAEDNVVKSDYSNHETTVGVSDQKWHIPFYVTKESLTEYSPDDVFRLRWECRKTVIDVNEIQYPNRRPLKRRE